MDAELKREKRRRQRQKVLSCCKKAIAFLFSHIGLSGLVVAYSIMGGFLFKALEGPAEYKDKLMIKAYKEEKVEQIFQLAVNYQRGGIEKGNFTYYIRQIFLEFQKNVTVAVKEKGWDGRDAKSDDDLQWSFAGALLYAVTVITTIGYGHVAPKTTWGRLVTILYALVGIPLTFLYLSNIGNFLADCFRLIYKRICCDICFCQKCEREKKRERIRRRRQREWEARQNALALVETKLYTEDETTFSYGLPGGGVSDPVQNSLPPYSEASQKPQNNEPMDKGQTNVCFDGCDSEQEIVCDGTALKNVADMRETDILDDEYDDTESEIRETAILDDEISNDSRVKESKTLNNCNNTGTTQVDRRDSPLIDDSQELLRKLPDARETAIVSDCDVTDSENEASMVLLGSSLDAEKSVGKDTDGKNKHRSLFSRFSKKSKKEKTKGKDNKGEEGVNKDEANADPATGDKSKPEESRANEKKKKKYSKKRKKDKDSGADEQGVTNHSAVECLSDTDKPQSSKSTKELSRSKHMSLRALKAKNREKKDLESLDLESPKLRRQTSSRDGSRRKMLEDSLESFATAHSSFAHVAREPEEPGHMTEQPEDDAQSEPKECEPNGDRRLLNRFSSLPADIGVMEEDMDIVPAVTITEQPEAVEFVDLASYQNDHSRRMAFLDEPFDYADDEDNEKVTVPISVCLVLLTAYVFAGSLLFALWEDWDYLTGSYFCFITLSTIGFGDIVPGTDMQEWNSEEKLVLCSLYLAFGLSLLAMCFNLMQEEVKEKCKWIGQKLGLLKDDNSP